MTHDHLFNEKFEPIVGGRMNHVHEWTNDMGRCFCKCGCYHYECGFTGIHLARHDDKWNRFDFRATQEQPERRAVDLDAHLERATRFAKAELEKQIAAMQGEEQPERRELADMGKIADQVHDYFKRKVQGDAYAQIGAAMYGLTASTPREVAEEKVRVLLECDAPTKALAFTMLRAEGMDSDRAKLILRDAKWLLP